MVLWFGPSTFQNLATYRPSRRCQHEESSCRASVPTSPRNWESFSVPGIVEITLFQKANQTQPLHNSTLKMKPFLAFLIKIFLAHFRGFVAFVVLWFGLSKFQNLTVQVSIVRCQYEELSVHMPFEAAQSRKDSCLSCLSKSAPTAIL